ncbi:AAA family ATPase [Pauljensenia sp. UMB3104]|uniref:ATP-binding protein n=1 Tax=Pauljensenia sp. UMB3104 TaxID=3046331 RepID=UPI00254DB663|nr:AAA family ATPase [Pauljensenia sp. UMB3104]MDK7160265.1 AAA family ATPase [Pauljensenia sp. UMB3104]
MTNPLIDSLASIIEQQPEDHALREHLAELLIAEGRGVEAVSHLAVVLAVDPHNERAAALMRSALGVPEAPAPSAPTVDEAEPAAPATDEDRVLPEAAFAGEVPVPPEAPEASAPAVDRSTAAESEPAAPASYEVETVPAPEAPAPSAPAAPASDEAGIPAIVTIHPAAFPQTAEKGNNEGGASTGEAGDGQDDPASADGADPENFDWKSAEKQVGGPAPAFVKVGATDGEVEIDDKPQGDAWDVETVTATLADVGGMQSVKDRLTMAFLAPLRNPEIRKLYGKSLSGGLLLYGPPGCGKTYIARALAGEVGAAFMNVRISDVLGHYIGDSENNLHDVFETARACAPVVLFLDEIDAVGMRRSPSSASYMRPVTNQLLMELDGIGADNEGVFILAATNTPWDVDPALRRPGRFDRCVAVLPPDGPARQAVLYHHLKSRPVEGIDMGYLVQHTDGFTGADLAHLVDSAVEYAMMDSVRTGNVRMVTMQDFLRALAQIRPSAGPWFVTARNIVEYGNRDGQYDDLAEYMKANNLM